MSKWQTIYILNYQEKVDFQTSDIYSGTVPKKIAVPHIENAIRMADRLKTNKNCHSFYIEKKEVMYLHGN
jgi:hypothetical protein